MRSFHTCRRSSSPVGVLVSYYGTHSGGGGKINQYHAFVARRSTRECGLSRVEAEAPQRRPAPIAVLSLTAKSAVGASGSAISAEAASTPASIEKLDPTRVDRSTGLGHRFAVVARSAKYYRNGRFADFFRQKPKNANAGFLRGGFSISLHHEAHSSYKA